MAVTRDALDEIRTSLAARYLAGRVGHARLDAVMQARTVALRFVTSGGEDRYATFADGNGNGARTADMLSGTDPQVTPYEAVGDKYPGVRFELQAGLPDLDGATGTGSAGIRIGSARILSLSPDGTATSGTLYLHGRRSQYAVRILGGTGRVRVFRFETGGAGWVAH